MTDEAGSDLYSLWPQTDGMFGDTTGFAGSVLDLGGGIVTATYLMQAVDSVTGDLYPWVSNSRDYAGAGYPGPNAPTQIAVSSVKT
jgi:hypothetical protein